MNVERRFSLAHASGAGPGLLLTAWMLTKGRLDLLEWQLVGNVYDAHAHGLLDGHLAVDPAVLSIDGFGGRSGTYLYQGPVPAVLRMPVMALFGDRLDGRLTQLSMLLAATVTVAVAGRLHWRVRRLLRGETGMDRTETVLVAVFAFVVAGGSVLLYLASRAWVYHEAIAWGIALTVAALDQLVGLLRRPSGWRLARASGFATLALLTRASIGIGPLAGLALVTVGVWATARTARRPESRWRTAEWLGPGRRGRHLPLGAYAAATALPFLAYTALNEAKFGRLLTIPFERQAFTEVDPAHRAMLAANHGTFFGPQFVPTTVLHYFRPDGLSLTRSFPFVDFRPPPGAVVGNAVFDLVDRTASMPSSLAFLFVLAATGAVLAFRRQDWPDPRWIPLRVPLLAALLSGLAVLPFGYVAHRYVGDFMPVLLLGGIVGLQALLRAGRSGPGLRWRRPVAAGLLVLALATTWVNLGLGLRYQRAWAPRVQPALAAGFAGFQRDVASVLGAGAATVARGAALPDGTGRSGLLFVVGDCDALYLSDGLSTNAIKRSPWNALEVARDGGHLRAALTFRREAPGTVVPIASIGAPAAPDLVVARTVDATHLVFGYRPADGPAVDGLPVRIEPGRRYVLDLVADWRVADLTVMLGDVRVASAFHVDPAPGLRLGTADGAAGRGGVTARFTGAAEELPVGTPLCRALLADRAGRP